MVRLWKGILLFMLILTACQSMQKDAKEDLEISPEQLEKLIETQTTNGQQKQVSLPQFITQMEASLAQQPEDTALIYELAKVCYQQYIVDSAQFFLQKSKIYYDQVLEIDANYEMGKTYYNRMLVQGELGNYEAGLKDIASFVAINRGRTPVNHQAMEAELLYQQGNIDRACAVFEQAVAVAKAKNFPVGNTAIWEDRCAR